MTIEVYNQKPSAFFTQYQSVSFERVHGDWLPLLPAQASLALYVGAGSSRDALALAERDGT